MEITKIRPALDHIKKACGKNLDQLYPAGVPEFVQERYERELNWLELFDSIENFEIFCRLSEAAEQTSQYMIVRGTAANLFLVYLLNGTGPNPLPAHYYCRQCGYLEMPDDSSVYGPDLPEISCPVCGTKIAADGFRLHEELAWRRNGTANMLDFEYRVSREFLPEAKRVLQECYPDRCVVKRAVEHTEADPDTGAETTRLVQYGYAVLPEGKTLEDYPELAAELEDGGCGVCGSLPVLESSGIKVVGVLSSELLDDLMWLQKEQGLNAAEIGLRRLNSMTLQDLLDIGVFYKGVWDMAAAEQPKDWRGLLKCYAEVHNSYRQIPFCEDWEKRAQEVRTVILQNPDFVQADCVTRDDFYERLMQFGVEKTAALRISRDIQMCRADRAPEFIALPVPEYVKRAAKVYSYMLPAADCLEFLLAQARAAYYWKHRKNKHTP